MFSSCQTSRRQMSCEDTSWSFVCMNVFLSFFFPISGHKIFIKDKAKINRGLFIHILHRKFGGTEQISLYICCNRHSDCDSDNTVWLCLIVKQCHCSCGSPAATLKTVQTLHVIHWHRKTSEGSMWIQGCRLCSTGRKALKSKINDSFQPPLQNKRSIVIVKYTVISKAPACYSL